MQMIRCAIDLAFHSQLILIQMIRCAIDLAFHSQLILIQMIRCATDLAFHSQLILIQMIRCVIYLAFHSVSFSVDSLIIPDELKYFSMHMKCIFTFSDSKILPGQQLRDKSCTTH